MVGEQARYSILWIVCDSGWSITPDAMGLRLQKMIENGKWKNKPPQSHGIHMRSLAINDTFSA